MRITEENGRLEETNWKREEETKGVKKASLRFHEVEAFCTRTFELECHECHVCHTSMAAKLSIAVAAETPTLAVNRLVHFLILAKFSLAKVPKAPKASLLGVLGVLSWALSAHCCRNRPPLTRFRG